jgi:hypothetical protein
MIAFPGITNLMRRSLEHDYCKRMAQEVLRSIIDFKNTIEMFTGTSYSDVERTELLNLGKIFCDKFY